MHKGGSGGTSNEGKGREAAGKGSMGGRGGTGGYSDRGGGYGRAAGPMSYASAAYGDHRRQERVDEQVDSQALAGLEKRVASMQQDFKQELHKISSKENEKFDLIFSILSELQNRQAQLEDSVRQLKSQYGGQASSNGAGVPGGPQGSGQQFGKGGGGPPPGGSGQGYNQMGAPVNGQMGGPPQGYMMPNDGGQVVMMGPQGPMTGQVIMMSPNGPMGQQMYMPQMMVQPMMQGGQMQYFDGQGPGPGPGEEGYNQQWQGQGPPPQQPQQEDQMNKDEASAISGVQNGADGAAGPNGRDAASVQAVQPAPAELDSKDTEEKS